MVVFPNCKINLGLHIISKRQDGFHNLETIFYPLSWCDALEIIHTDTRKNKEVFPQEEECNMNFSGLNIPGNQTDNICLKAYQLIKKDFPGLPAVTMHLHKEIPMGAGLGGGSSDGAFMLRLLNKNFGLQLKDETLIQYAAHLGSDCPFFILNKPCFASGRGEIMSETTIDLSHYSFLIIHPGIHINTAWAFSKLSPGKPLKPVQTIIRQPAETWKDELINDFELPVFKEYPEIKELKELLYNNGAVYASMTGSGSAVYGIFKKNTIPELKLNKNHVFKIIA